MSTEADSPSHAVESLAEDTSSIVEGVAENVVQAATQAIEAAEQRAEHAEAVAGAIVEHAHNTAIVQEAQKGHDELWNRLNGVEDRLSSALEIVTEQRSLISTLTETLSQLVQVKQEPETPQPSEELSTEEPLTSELSPQPVEPSSLNAEDAVENPVPALKRLRRAL